MSEPPDSPQALVELLKARGELRDPRIEAAFLATPRALFLPDLPPEQVYADAAIPIKSGPEGAIFSSSSQPSMMAIMLEQLQLEPGHNVLEIGTGTGYNAAIIAHIVGPHGRVTTIEIDRAVADDARTHLQKAKISAVSVVEGDGALGYPARAAYDRIIATAGIWDVPRIWRQQLKKGGILVAPIWLEGMQYSAAFHLQPDGSLLSADNYPCGFIPLRGVSAGPELRVRVGSGLLLQSSDVARLDSAALQMMLSEDASSGHLGVFLSASEFAHSLIPFIALNLPDELIFASYSTPVNQQPFGIEGSGFALLAQGSACFVPMQEAGKAIVFGGADTLLAAQDLVSAWQRAGAPSAARLRLRLIPREQTLPRAPGRAFTRADHHLFAWLEGAS
ncbi:MAG: methyltransferase domain-containing protein [Aggregatilineales bacterium]